MEATDRGTVARLASRWVSRRPSTVLPEHVSPWLLMSTALGAVALWIGNGKVFTNFYDGVMMLSILNLTLGVAVFWAGSEITATNIYGFAFALFVGFAGIFTLTSYSQGVYIPYRSTRRPVRTSVRLSSTVRGGMSPEDR